MAASIADELRSLAALIEQHQQRTHEKGKRQRGDCSLFILATLAFMSATYLNQVDWIDAALSIAAQVSAALFARHTRAQSQQATTTKGAAERLFILK
ncbi:hypothetical protein WS62_07790 [Burkholderia sp. ABCPW 14]|nr:hypothetical protein WS62_07790 [Burkholderia sp. ABCPW 14]